MNRTTEVARLLLESLFALKMYHWSTTSYARHKASDFFYTSMQPLIDQFIETMSPRYGLVEVGGSMISEKIMMIDDESVIALLTNLCKYLNTRLSEKLDPKQDTDLISIKDDILAITHQTLYLFNLK